MSVSVRGVGRGKVGCQASKARLGMRSAKEFPHCLASTCRLSKGFPRFFKELDLRSPIRWRQFIVSDDCAPFATTLARSGWLSSLLLLDAFILERVLYAPDRHSHFLVIGRCYCVLYISLRYRKLAREPTKSSDLSFPSLYSALVRLGRQVGGGV